MQAFGRSQETRNFQLQKSNTVEGQMQEGGKGEVREWLQKETGTDA